MTSATAISSATSTTKPRPSHCSNRGERGRRNNTSKPPAQTITFIAKTPRPTVTGVWGGASVGMSHASRPTTEKELNATYARMRKRSCASPANTGAVGAPTAGGRVTSSRVA